jgi:DNA-binding protein HU-beta
MNRPELVKAISEDSGISQKDTNAVINSFVKTVGDALASGDNVKISGFGTFKRNHYKEHIGRNPKTGKAVNVPDKYVPAFKAGLLLKEAVK